MIDERKQEERGGANSVSARGHHGHAMVTVSRSANHQKDGGRLAWTRRVRAPSCKVRLACSATPFCRCT
eukprot:scaffold122_cov136-Isochrysis_galbana.AAC.2